MPTGECCQPPDVCSQCKLGAQALLTSTATKSWRESRSRLQAVAERKNFSCVSAVFPLLYFEYPKRFLSNFAAKACEELCASQAVLHWAAGIQDFFSCSWRHKNFGTPESCWCSINNFNEFSCSNESASLWRVPASMWQMSSETLWMPPQNTKPFCINMLRGETWHLPEKSLHKCYGLVAFPSVFHIIRPCRALEVKEVMLQFHGLLTYFIICHPGWNERNAQSKSYFQ